MALDLVLQPWLRSRSRPDCGLDLEPWQIRSSGSRSNLWPGLDLDVSHGLGSISNAVAAALDLICSQV